MNGVYWFKANDIVKSLNIDTNLQRPTIKISHLYKRTWADLFPDSTRPRNQRPHQMYINTDGVYLLAISNKNFAKWIENDVLPKMRDEPIAEAITSLVSHRRKRPRLIEGEERVINILEQLELTYNLQYRVGTYQIDI